MFKYSKSLILVFVAIIVIGGFVIFQFVGLGKNKNRVLALEAQNLENENQAVYICPEAASMEEITPFCPGIIILHLGETASGMTLTVTEYEGQEYYAVAGFVNGGGGEFGASDESLKGINDYIQGLPDEAFKNNPDQRRNTLLKKIQEVYSKIENQEYQEAINKLQNDIRAKADGEIDGQANNDWIVSVEAQAEVCEIADNLVAYLQGLL